MRPYTIELSRKRNEKPGYLVPLEDTDLGFPIRRVFTISGLKDGGKRGYHGHRETTTQCIVCLQGAVEIECEGEFWTLDRDTLGFVIPPDNYIVMDLKPDTILMVLCSTLFAEDVRFETNTK
jgi:hypothetical protein